MEVSLGMRADRAYFGRFLAYYDMTAVRALPYSVAVLGEYQVAFYVCKQLSISFFVFLFNCRNAVEQGSDIVEAFFTSNFRKFRIHIRPFVVFAFRSSKKVFRGGRDFAAVQKLEPNFCVFLFVLRRFFKQRCYLYVSFLLRLALKGKKRRPPVLVTVHGYLFSKAPKGIREHILLFCERLVRDQTDAIAVMNQEDLEIARRYKLSNGPIFFLSGMGLPEPPLSIRPIDIRKRYAIPKKELLLGYVGELSERKNQIFLIRAIAKLREEGVPAHLVLLGDGAKREALEREARRIGIAPHVILLGEWQDASAFL